MPQRLESMHQAAAANSSQSRDQLRRIAHDIAGTAGSLGYPRTGSLAAELESHVVSTVEPDGTDLLARVATLARAFEAERSAPPPDAPDRDHR